ncbi:ABC transporter ATP-binding protein [Roseibium aggregatum]|uniref:ABC transporter ATP-binding protein n=1 Tax=Roseibium aggregatum TaxID=187304 RepID=UPI003A9761E8
MTFAIKNVGCTVAGETWLEDVTLSFEPGNLYVLLGRTGAGKTSLLRVLAGLHRPDSGTLVQNGTDLTGMPVRRRDIAFVYQQFVNYPSFTVYDNIAAPLRRKRMDRAALDAKVRDAARMVHIDHLLDRLPQNLSGGQQQRLAIARALVKEAGVLLLDEPLVNLDYKLREELRADLRQIFRGRGATVVYSTTEPDEALQMGGTTIVMEEGRVIQVGPAAEVHANPCSVKVAEIFYDPPMNVITGHVSGQTIDFAGIRTALPAHMQGHVSGACLLGVPPHRIRPATSGQTGDLAGRVSLCEVDGSATFVHFEYGGHEWVMKRDGVHPQASGSDCRVTIDPAGCFLFDASGQLLATPGPRQSEAA